MGAPKLKKCRGLYTASNRYDVPEGALTTATNILIYKDGVIQPRWGLVASATTMAVGNVSHWHRAAEFNGGLWYAGRDTVANTYSIGRVTSPTAYSGVSVWESGYDSPSQASNFTGTSLYFDMDLISFNNTLFYNTFTGFRSGIRGSSGGPECAVALMPRKLSVTAATRSSNVTTVTTAIPHFYAVGVNITTTGYGTTFTVASIVDATNFTIADVGVNGAVGITSVTATNLVGSSGFMGSGDRVRYVAQITAYASDGTVLPGPVSTSAIISNASPFIGTAAGKNVQLAVLYGATGQTTLKLEVYRSALLTAATIAASSIPVEPDASMKLVYSKFLTQTEIDNRVAWVTDITPDQRRDKAACTNEDQDGLFQNNNTAPACKTVATWGRRLVLGNTVDDRLQEFQLLSVDSSSGGMAAGDVFYVDDPQATASTAYTAVASGTAMTSANQFQLYSGGTASSDVKHTVLSLVDTINYSAYATFSGPMSYYLASWVSQVGEWPGRFNIRRLLKDQYTVTSNTSKKTVFTASQSGTSTRGCFAPILGAKHVVSSASRTANVVTVNTTGNHNFAVGDAITLWTSWANQTSALTGTVASIPSATSLTFASTGSNGAITADTITTTYMPQMQHAYYPARIRVSKTSPITGNLPEAFPEANYLEVGNPGANILKMVQCKDSLMVFKEDGLFRVTASGAYGENLSAELVDPNAILWAKDSAVAINGKVMAWLTKGVAIINEQGIEKYVSLGRIDDRLAPATTRTAEPDLLAYPFSRRAQAFVDEKHNLYELRVCLTANPSAPYASTTNLIYNTENDTWVEDDLAVVSEVFYQGKRYIQQGTTFYAQDDKVYAGTNTTQSISSAGNQFAQTSVTDVWSYINSGGTIPVGSYIYSSDIPSANVGVVLTSASGSGTAYFPGSFAAGSDWLSQSISFVIYNSVTSTIAWAPITFGEENKLKRHKELQVMFGVREQLTANVRTASELVTTTETNVVKLGAVSTSVGVNGYAPASLRMTIPQQHRVAQQLQVALIIYTAYGPWTILGIGCDADILKPRITR